MRREREEEEEGDQRRNSPQASNRLSSRGTLPVSADNGAGVGNQNVRTITDAI